VLGFAGREGELLTRTQHGSYRQTVRLNAVWARAKLRMPPVRCGEDRRRVQFICYESRPRSSDLDAHTMLWLRRLLASPSERVRVLRNDADLQVFPRPAWVEGTDRVFPLNRWLHSESL
jgi:hypothetical protein